MSVYCGQGNPDTVRRQRVNHERTNSTSDCLHMRSPHRCYFNSCDDSYHDERQLNHEIIMSVRTELRLNIFSAKPPVELLYRVLSQFVFGWRLTSIDYDRKPCGRWWVATEWKREPNPDHEIRDAATGRLLVRQRFYRRASVIDHIRVLWFWWAGQRTERLVNHERAHRVADAG